MFRNEQTADITDSVPSLACDGDGNQGIQEDAIDSHYLVDVLWMWICYGLGLTCTLGIRIEFRWLRKP